MSANVRLVLVAVLSGIAGSLFTALVTGPGRDQAPPSPISISDFSGLEERLDQLIQVVAQRPSVRAPAAGDVNQLPAERQPMNESETVANLAQELGDLGALVRRMSSTAMTTTAEVTSIGQNYASPNWEAIRGLRGHLDENRTAVNSNHLFLTPADILRMYGRPTTITVDGNTETWDYAENEPNTAVRVHTYVTFHNGYVVRVRKAV